MKRAALLIPLALVALAGPAPARQPSGDLPALQAQRRDELARARRLRADAAAATVEIAALDRRLQTMVDDVAAGDQVLASQRARLAALNAYEGALTRDLAREQAASGRLLSALQMLSRRPPPPLLVPADKAVDTVRAAILIRAMTPDLRRRASVLAARQTELARLRRDAILSSERLLTAESDQGDRRAALEALRQRKADLAEVLRLDAETAERAAAALDDRIRALGGRPLDAPEAPQLTAANPAGRSRLTAPVDGAPRTAFGARSAGLRWAASGPVKAPADARVAYVGPLAGWGSVVILDLGPGWRGVVAGLSSTDVEAGQRVADGAVLGQADGEAYFELRRDDQPVDPSPWLR
ncbi:MAG: peptidase M23 [Brevundimonas sp.]|nr:MAG: peptidase M23 [Brevundimonas sp.]